MRKQEALSVEAQLLAEISLKLDRVIAVLAAQGKDKDRQVEILAQAGSDSAFIGTIIGTTPGRVRQLDSWKRAKQRAEGAGDDEGTHPE
jgi:hypothetical protein